MCIEICKECGENKVYSTTIGLCLNCYQNINKDNTSLYSEEEDDYYNNRLGV